MIPHARVCCRVAVSNAFAFAMEAALRHVCVALKSLKPASQRQAVLAADVSVRSGNLTGTSSFKRTKLPAENVI